MISSVRTQGANCVLSAYRIDLFCFQGAFSGIERKGCLGILGPNAMQDQKESCIFVQT